MYDESLCYDGRVCYDVSLCYDGRVCVVAKNRGFSYNPKFQGFYPFATRRKQVMALFDAQFVSKKIVRA